VSVEILSVSLSDESVEALAQRLAQLLGAPPVTQSNPPAAQTPQPAASPESGEPADPWQNQQAQQYQPQPQQYQQQAPPPQQYQQAPPAQQGQQYNAQVPTCAHGPMRYVPGGTIKSGPRAGQSYPPFYGCQLPKGAPGKCASVQA